MVELNLTPRNSESLASSNFCDTAIHHIADYRDKNIMLGALI